MSFYLSRLLANLKIWLHSLTYKASRFLIFENCLLEGFKVFFLMLLRITHGSSLTFRFTFFLILHLSLGSRA